MNITRRSFLADILALGVAPAVVKASSIMRVRPIVLQDQYGRWVESRVDQGDTEIMQFCRRRISADGFVSTMETWYEDANGFLLPHGRLDMPRGEYLGTNRLWGADSA